MANGPLVRISIRGGDLVIIDSQVYAVLIGPPEATTWFAGSADDGTIRFTDQSGGLVLGTWTTGPGAPAVVAPAAAGLAVGSWSVTRYGARAEAGPDPTPAEQPGPIKDLTRLTSGYYAIQEPNTGAYLYRNRIEDLSLMPKQVALQPGSPDQGPLLIQVVG